MIPGDIKAGDLVMTHISTNFDRTGFQRDWNIVFPLTDRFWRDDGRTKLFGVTVSDGAYEKHTGPDGTGGGPSRIRSRFMDGEVIDLVGAGDSFRAGFITYISLHLDQFRDGSINFEEAVQMGNMFASLFIKAPLEDRYGNIKPYDKMLKTLREALS